MAEETLFQDAAATVTTSRVILNGTTYALTNITSVRSFEERRPVSFLVIGGILALGGYSCATMPFEVGKTFGTIEGLVGVAFCLGFFLWRTRHWVRIGTAGSETNAVFSRDSKWTASVVSAINDAIVRRG